jgi:DNA-binding transcriptional ArsR family regulator
MPRAATTTDVFSAIAEPKRRDIVDLLARSGEQPVGAIVVSLQLPQPAVSKHLSVLRKVGLVAVTRRGRERVYRVNAKELKAVHDWTKTFERFWDHQLDRLKEHAERKAREKSAARPQSKHPNSKSEKHP